jgi:hypothetical protein
MKKNKLFPWIVALSAVTISFSAAFYSIFGLGRMFAGASTNVMVMAASLEFAKLVIASFLYRFWDDVNKALRVYLSIACLVLILITSAGIYGFLSSAYQETANKVENVDQKSSLLTRQKDMLQRQLSQAEKQLEFKNQRQQTLSDMRNRQQTNADNLISQNKSASSIKSQMASAGKEIEQLDKDIKVLQDTITSKNTQISELDSKIVETSTNNSVANEIGPLKYIAKITGKSLDQVVNWFIIALMLVFDPLAIALVVAANFVFSKLGEDDKKEEKEKPKEETKEEPKEDIKDEIEEIAQEDIEDTQIEELSEEEVDIPQEEEIEEAKEAEEDKKEFGGYKLGNTITDKAEILKSQIKKYIRGGDPTRLS